MAQFLFEPHKKPGVHYALTDQGTELPVIDVTHPSFRVTPTQEHDVKAARYIRAQTRRNPLLRWAQTLVLPFFLRRSVIGRGLLRSYNGYLDGMSTYLMKLGPAHLGPWATKMDHKFAEGMESSGLFLRLRVQDMAEILADRLAPLLAAGPQRPLHFVNIAGGPSMDSLNTLILLRQHQGAGLQGRPIAIHVMDLESEGAHFAAAALAALQEEGGPLRDLDISLRHLDYDWNQTSALSYLLQALAGDALVAVSSEGGLFDYGDDAAVLANLKALYVDGPKDIVVAASLSHPQGTGSILRRGAKAGLVLRELKDLERLAEISGWTVTESRRRPMGYTAALKKMAL